MGRRRKGPYLEGSEEIRGLSFLGLDDAVEKAVVKEIRSATRVIFDGATRRLSGGRLHVRTGELLASLRKRMRYRKGISVTGTVASTSDGRGARHGVMWERGHLRHGPAPGPADRIMVARPFLKPALDDAKRTDPRARIEAVVKAAARSV
jgi:hypothetical protein